MSKLEKERRKRLQMQFNLIALYVNLEEMYLAQFTRQEYLAKIDSLLDEIISITTNTKPRLLAYLALSKALDGTVSVGLTGDTCE